MVYVAEVIVDVPAMQTDTPYTYLIPSALGTSVQTGMRVEVPFGQGNRHVQGFVMGVKQVAQESLSHLALKEIVAVLDLEPVLNPELLALADEMKETTFSFKITCLQTMLPSVMRASYQKWLVLTDEVPEEILYDIFKGQDELTWEEALASGRIADLMRLRQHNQIEIRYEVKQRNRSKTVRAFTSRLSFERIEEERESLQRLPSKSGPLNPLTAIRGGGKLYRD